MELTTIMEEVEQNGFVVIPIRGISMLPLLHQDTSHVLIRKLKDRPKKNDVVLYVRPDGTQVLHRLMGYDEDVCLIRGDNTYGMERVPISAVKGVMETAWRGEKEIQVSDFQYRLYVQFWNLVYPLRLMKHKAKVGIVKIGKYLLGNTSLAWVIKMARGSLVGILLLIICSCLTSVLSVVLALVMREAIDAAVALNRDAFLHWAAVFLGVIVTTLGLNAIIRQFDESVRATIENHIKEHTYSVILRSRYSDLKRFHTGELQNRMTNDVKVVADYATDLVPDVLAMATQLVCALIVLLMIDWRFGSLFLAGGIVMLFVTFLFRKRMKGLHKQVQKADGKLRSWLQESVESLLILKGFEAESMAGEQTKVLTGDHKQARMRRRTFSNICNIGFGAVMQGGYLFGLVWCGFGILQGAMTYGTLTAVLQLINHVRGPFANISSFIPHYYAMLASAERLIELEQLPKDSCTKQETVEFESLHARNLTFIYDDGEEEVLSDVSFDIEKGEIVALTGISGIGKSTLLKILLGIYSPVSGQLYAGDGNQWVEIDVSTRRWFSYVPQGNMLMSGNIYEAVDFLHTAPYTKKQKEDVKRACEIACADEFIRELPHGYDTVLGEKGAGLSEGQMQRLAIARAVYRNAPMLLLDEATSALDEATEHRVLENLKNMGNQAVLIVTHRPAAMEICNKRLVFSHASITEEITENNTSVG
ncbi:MAG: ATP-binding cassette domain-containing protein [Clostridiales bacterium]|nr:ATP-binding cassette domain-containing protein [Clostridiales bacterium]